MIKNLDKNIANTGNTNPFTIETITARAKIHIFSFV
jgi:hypothetical protein